MYSDKTGLFEESGFFSDKSACIRERILLLVKVVVFVQKLLCLGKNGLYSGKIVLFGIWQNWLYSSKVVAFGQNGCFRAKLVVFGK